MPDLGEGLLGCYRCGNVWRFRKSPVRICPRCKSKYWDTPRPKGRPTIRSTRGLGVKEIVGNHRGALFDLADKYGVSDIRVFGSVARGEAGPKSDVDLLVSLTHPLGLIRRAQFREEAERILGRRVDVATERTLHWLIRPDVVAEAVPL